ncbi:Na+/H+ antiporter NhaA [Streptomyces nigra]
MSGNEPSQTHVGQSTRTARWRSFSQTEAGSAVLLLASVAAALLWANLDLHSYETVWSTSATIGFSDHLLSLDLREWINAGLMSLFFFVVGLEARREFDLGELRNRRWLLLVVAVGVVSTLVPAAIYVFINAGHGTVHGWGTAMSTDSAFALGILAVFGSRLPASLRAFMLSISVINDLLGLVVIGLFYSHDMHLPALLVAIGALAAIAVVRRMVTRSGGCTMVLSLVVWVALHEAGVDPVVTGLAVGALVLAYPAPRDELEQASRLFRLFREQPTPQLHRSAVQGLAAAISPNDRLEQSFLPWVSFGIVPLFALANAGIELNSEGLAEAFSSPVTLGILIGCLAGKVIAVVGSLAMAQLLSRGRLRPAIGWGSITAGGTIAGAAFTVSLLIASLTFTGSEFDQARIGILATLAGAFVLSWAVTGAIALLSPVRRARALLGEAGELIDLAVGVDARHDKIRGPRHAPVTLVEYGDFECPYCGQAEAVVRELLANESDVCYVWRHLPLTDVHPHAQLAAEAAEAAAQQGSFWEMHDLLFRHQTALTGPDLLRYADELGLDVERFGQDLDSHRGARRVAEDVDSADLSKASGTPTFFINGRRHYGAYDIRSLTQAVEHARQRTLLR